jgi:hypothetical protein
MRRVDLLTRPRRAKIYYKIYQWKSCYLPRKLISSTSKINYNNVANNISSTTFNKSVFNKNYFVKKYFLGY